MSLADLAATGGNALLAALDALYDAPDEQALIRQMERLAEMACERPVRFVRHPDWSDGSSGDVRVPVRLGGGPPAALSLLHDARGSEVEVRATLLLVAATAERAFLQVASRSTTEAELDHLRHVADELRDARESLDRTLEDAPIGMTLVSVDGRFVRVNRALCDIVGYEPDELIRLRFHDITHPDDLEADLQLLGELVRGERARYDLGKRYVRRDGRLVHVHLYVSAMRAADGRIQYFISQIVDVTERVRAAEELARLEQLRVEWTSLVAHELRQPLSVIRTSAALLERLETPLAQRSATHILSSSARLDRMITDLSDLSRIEASRLTVEQRRLPTATFLAAAVERLAAQASGHALVLRAPAELPDMCADPARVEQVLANLVGNAAKYGEPETPIVVAAERVGPTVRIGVGNRGPEIPVNERERLFERFRRGTDVKKRPGLGLGLYIARGLVEAQGGRIDVVCADGWTTFRFTVPIATGTAAC